MKKISIAMMTLFILLLSPVMVRAWTIIPETPEDDGQDSVVLLEKRESERIEGIGGRVRIAPRYIPRKNVDETNIVQVAPPTVYIAPPVQARYYVPIRVYYYRPAINGSEYYIRGR